MATSPPKKPFLQAADPAELAPGTLIDGRYRVVRVIGVGGTGIVYEVEHDRTGQRLALKTLLDPAQAPRLEQEARALARLRSAHVVKVVELGHCDAGPFMVMSLLVGRNLRDVLETKVRLPLSFVANLALQVCEGLDEAHRVGLVHRDLKPDNMHLADPAEADTETTGPLSGSPTSTKPPHDLTFVTVFDFGVVKMSASEVNNPLTRTGSTVGTPYYMSLEQLRGAGTVDAQSDVYALCVVLYECLAGQRPFEAGTLGDLIFAICSINPPHLSGARPDLPRDVTDTVMRGLSREKKDRPQTMRDLAKVFAPFADPSFTVWLRVGDLPPPPRSPESSTVPMPLVADMRITVPSRPPPAAIQMPAPPPPPSAPTSRPSVPARASAPDPPTLIAPPKSPLGPPAPPGAPPVPPVAPVRPGAPPRPPLAPPPPRATGAPRGTLPVGAPSPLLPQATQAMQRPTAAEVEAAVKAEKAAGPTDVDGATPTPIDEESSTGTDDRETPTEMYQQPTHGDLLKDLVEAAQNPPAAPASGRDEHPASEPPTGVKSTDANGSRPAVPRSPADSEDKTAILDLAAFQKNPPNPSPQYTSKPDSGAAQAAAIPIGSGGMVPTTALPQIPGAHHQAPFNPQMTSRIPFPPSSQSGIRASSPNLAPIHEVGTGSGMSAYGHPSFVPRPKPKWELMITDSAEKVHQLVLKIIARFRKASQEQQIVVVMIGTATLAIVIVVLIWAIWL